VTHELLSRAVVPDLHDAPFVRISPEIVVAGTLLSGFHQDPADQIIVATSRTLKIPLLTADRRILDLRHVEALW